jgi:hypothetical protein
VKWRSNGFCVALSDCGDYEVRMAEHVSRGRFYNAWHLPTGKHIGASHKKAEVVAACERHAEAIDAEVPA